MLHDRMAKFATLNETRISRAHRGPLEAELYGDRVLDY